MDVKTHAVPEHAHGWTSVWAPSAIPFNDMYPVPQAMTDANIEELKRGFVESTRRAKKAGYDVVELHYAHGYLGHSFLCASGVRR